MRGKLNLIKRQLKIHTYFHSSDSIMGMEVLLHFCKESGNGKVLDINMSLGWESHFNAIAIMLAHYIVLLNIMHQDRLRPLISTTKEPLQREIRHSEIREQPSVLEQLIYVVYHLTSFIYKNSYISLIIVMMVSITL